MDFQEQPEAIHMLNEKHSILVILKALNGPMCMVGLEVVSALYMATHCTWYYSN